MDENLEYDETKEYYVVLEKVLASKEHLSVTRLLAASLIAEPYMTVQQWLIGLSDRDLDILLQTAEDEDSKEFGELLLIAQMLATAEGLSPGDLDIITQRVAALTGFIVVESLFRKGMVKIYRENMSFGEEMGNKVIVERL